MKDIVTNAVPESESGSTHWKDPRADPCYTFVMATQARASGTAFRMRSYDTRYSDAFVASIWEVARATTATPMLFQPIAIKDILYEGGQAAWNNPTQEAIAEFRDIWANRPIGIVVSVGASLTGSSEYSSQEFTTLIEDMHLDPSSKQTSLIAEYAAMSSRCCESVHQKVLKQFSADGLDSNYFRLNVMHGISLIGSSEWERAEEILSLTNEYMNSRRLSNQKIAALLLNLDDQQPSNAYDPDLDARTALAKTDIHNQPRIQSLDGGRIGNWTSFWPQIDSEFLRTIGKREEKRQQVIFEFIQDEEEYAQNLNIILNLFRDQLVASANTATPIINPDRLDLFVKTVFGCVPPILEWQTKALLMPLRERLVDQGPLIRGVGDIVQNWVQGCREIYADYAGNFILADLLVREEQAANPVFAQWLEVAICGKDLIISDYELIQLVDGDLLTLL